MILYIIFIVVVWILCVLNDLRKFGIGFTMTAILVYLGIVAFRPAVTPDQEFYRNLVYSVTIEHNLPNISEVLRFEVGFAYLIYYGSELFGGSERLTLLIPAAINTFIFIFFSWKIYNLWLREGETGIGVDLVSGGFSILSFLLIYLGYYGTMYNFCVLRAGISISLLYGGLYFSLLGRRYSAFLLSCCFIALSLLFHRSAIIGIIPWQIILWSRPARKGLYIGAWVFMISFYLLRLDKYVVALDLNSLLGLSENKDESLFGSYWVRNEVWADRYSFRILFYIIVYGFLLLVPNRNQIHCKIFNLQTLGMVAMAIFGNMNAAARIVDFSILFTPILVYMGLKHIREKFMRAALFSAFLALDLTFTLRLIDR